MLYTTLLFFCCRLNNLAESRTADEMQARLSVIVDTDIRTWLDRKRWPHAHVCYSETFQFNRLLLLLETYRKTSHCSSRLQTDQKSFILFRHNRHCPRKYSFIFCRNRNQAEPSCFCTAISETVVLIFRSRCSMTSASRRLYMSYKWRPVSASKLAAGKQTRGRSNMTKGTSLARHTHAFATLLCAVGKLPYKADCYMTLEWHSVLFNSNYGPMAHRFGDIVNFLKKMGAHNAP